MLRTIHTFYAARLGQYTITLFPDGRGIIGGTSDIAEARSLYAKFVGTKYEPAHRPA